MVHGKGHGPGINQSYLVNEVIVWEDLPVLTYNRGMVCICNTKRGFKKGTIILELR